MANMKEGSEITEGKVMLRDAPEAVQESYAAGQQLHDHDIRIAGNKGKLSSYDEAVNYQRTAKDRQIAVDALRTTFKVVR